MDRKVIGPIQIDGVYIPKGAKGVHKVKKVMFFNSVQMKYKGYNEANTYVKLSGLDKSGGYSGYSWENGRYLKINPKKEETLDVNVNYGVVLLDNDVVINVMPGFGDLFDTNFSKVGQLLLLSEGENVEFVEVMG